jgi:methanogenic corrinoid protein MtbC1
MTHDAVHLAGEALAGSPHACAFFHSRDDEYRTLLPFVQEGLERGEKAVHFVDIALRDDHLARMSAAGIDVGAAQARNQLEVFDWVGNYVPGGTFDRRATTSRMKALLTRTRAQGFPRVRLIGHGDWTLQDPASLAGLVEYEARMTDILAAYDASAVCVYDRTRFGGAMIADILRVHPTAVLDGGLLENPFLGAPTRLLSRLHGRAVSVLRDQFQVALAAGARREALEIVPDEALWLDVPAPAVYLEVVQASLYEIGRLWQEGRITIAQEHVATEIARQALAQLRLHLPSTSSNGKRVVVACVEGELHDLGALMTADFLEMAGFEVSYLGANVPTASLTELVRHRPPHLLALSATAPSSVATLRRAVAAVRRVSEGGVPLAVGGQVFRHRPELARQLAADVHARDARAATTAIHRLLGA